ncbi:Protein NRT1/ PTR FAMILY 5.10 like [Quillaja saponaria]|uniref:Protein NRT1/ PTR FAMILY 5.10 like n=1 Tax=Quillaja saponaria TaxID=32244 RepID=A0AAD7KTU7_QUISA|nr:Protein NRT1/ PTR FAMILY 5.10 like [Quillaja saponaria]
MPNCQLLGPYELPTYEGQEVHYMRDDNASMNSGIETPLIAPNTVHGAVDYKGRPVTRSNFGGWRSAWFIIVVEVAERSAYKGIAGNLISYLTGPLGQPVATAAANVNLWIGTGALLPLLGAFVADSYFGRYRTIVLSSVVYILGLGLLTLSATLISYSSSKSYSPQMRLVLIFISLYLVAIGLAGHKPCLQSFGADQFDEQHPEERKSRSSFFNWWYFSICSGMLLTLLILNYIQDNLSWSLGFGIPCITMIIGLVVFLLGTRTYRYTIQSYEKSPFVRIARVFAAAIRNRKSTLSAVATKQEAHQSFEQFRFLNKALLAPNGSKEGGESCSITEVEEAKAVLSLIQIWTTCLTFGIVFAQVSTFYTKQGATMDRKVFPGFDISAASLQSFGNLTIVLLTPVYDRIFVPIARSFTSKHSGITMLQRIGTGIVMSMIGMAVAALVEMKRLRTAKDYGLVDKPDAIIPMSVWWLIPQYTLDGVSHVFTMVGIQEFFYDQAPTELRSMGVALYLSVIGVGSFLSSFLISAIEEATGGDGRDSWFANNLNRAHLDYFYWLLAGLCAVSFVLYMHFAKSYIYNKKGKL